MGKLAAKLGKQTKVSTINEYLVKDALSEMKSEGKTYNEMSMYLNNMALILKKGQIARLNFFLYEFIVNTEPESEWPKHNVLLRELFNKFSRNIPYMVRFFSNKAGFRGRSDSIVRCNTVKAADAFLPIADCYDELVYWTKKETHNYNYRSSYFNSYMWNGGNYSLYYYLQKILKSKMHREKYFDLLVSKYSHAYVGAIYGKYCEVFNILSNKTFKSLLDDMSHKKAKDLTEKNLPRHISKKAKDCYTEIIRSYIAEELGVSSSRVEDYISISVTPKHKMTVKKQK